MQMKCLILILNPNFLGKTHFCFRFSNSLCESRGHSDTFIYGCTSGVPHRFNNHANKAFDVLTTMWRNKHLCDVVLGIAGTDVEIECHRNILASCSPYFYAMFRNDLAESSSDKIMLHVSDRQTHFHDTLAYM